MAGILYPVLVLGGLYANYFSTKELDDISTLEKTRRPLSDFWSGICVGVIIGVWAGINYGPSLKYAWETLDWMSRWALSPSEKRPPNGPGPQSPHQVPRGGPQPQVYYPSAHQQ
mmetsp:Transcript_137368/g.194384  ORF Transcript_137368/g.194384 Transcript_137368/m.194384 type:complete len:114 (+) Transcript_137368:26-367(+)